MFMASKDNHISSHRSSCKRKRAKRYMCIILIIINIKKTCGATKKTNKKDQRVGFDLFSAQRQPRVGVRKPMGDKVASWSRSLADLMRSAKALHLCSWFLILSY